MSTVIKKFEAALPLRIGDDLVKGANEQIARAKVKVELPTGLNGFPTPCLQITCHAAPAARILMDKLVAGELPDMEITIAPRKADS